jgi:hypothetical protein
VTGEDLRGAIEALRTCGEVTDTQYPSAGCSIKWRPENTPAYAG